MEGADRRKIDEYLEFIFQRHFLPTIEVMKIVSGLIAFIELKSLDENLKDMTGKSLFKQFFKEGK